MTKFVKFIITGLIVSTCFSCTPSEKIGVLYIDVGTPPQHKLDWYVGFFEVFPDIFFPGWFAGGCDSGRSRATAWTGPGSPPRELPGTQDRARRTACERDSPVNCR